MLTFAVAFFVGQLVASATDIWEFTLKDALYFLLSHVPSRVSKDIATIAKGWVKSIFESVQLVSVVLM